MNIKIILQQMYSGKNITSVNQYSKTGQDVWYTINFDDGTYDNKQDSDIQNYYTANQTACDNAEKFQALVVLQGQLLTQLQPLMNAITAQKESIADGLDASKVMFTQDQIIACENYIATVANAGIDLTEYTVEQITPAIFGELPDLPISYQNIIKG